MAGIEAEDEACLHVSISHNECFDGMEYGPERCFTSLGMVSVVFVVEVLRLENWIIWARLWVVRAKTAKPVAN